MTGVVETARPRLADEERWWTVSPLDRRAAATVIVSYVVLTAVLTAVGLIVVELWEPSRFGGWDGDVNRWFEERRTGMWDSATRYGSMLSATPTMIALSAVLLPVFLFAFRSWREWTQVVLGLCLESSVFVTAATLAGRDRPPVERLDSAPTNSFPSGHIAAATVFYLGLAVVLNDHVRSRVVRVVIVVIAGAVIVTVILSRVYRGMHYPTDAAAGVALGLAALIVVRTSIDHTRRRRSLQASSHG
jgi:undecaprenyl-diphosphatase